MLLYSICYYYGKNKTSNIKNHLEAFSKIKKDGDLFILNTMIDSKEQCVHEEIKQTLSSFITSILDSPFVILTSFNWGGTIVGLWMAYNYGKANNLNTYIAHFEEDFGPGNNKWLSDSIKLLEEDDSTYQVGESTIGRIKRENDDGRITYCDYQNSVRLGDPEVWSDGGYYFSTIAKLKIVESKIGIFHKGDSLVRYSYIKDGIDLGEVGYPTLLYHANLTFKVLNRPDYYK